MPQEEAGSCELCFALGSQTEWTWDNSVQPVIRVVGWNEQMQPSCFQGICLWGWPQARQRRARQGTWSFPSCLDCRCGSLPGVRWNPPNKVSGDNGLWYLWEPAEQLLRPGLWAHPRKVNMPLGRAWSWFLAAQFNADLALIQDNQILEFERGKYVSLFFFPSSISLYFQFITSESIKGSEDVVLCLKSALAVTLSHPVWKRRQPPSFLIEGVGSREESWLSCLEGYSLNSLFSHGGPKNRQSHWLEQCTCQVLPGTEKEGHVSKRAEGKQGRKGSQADERATGGETGPGNDKGTGTSSR